jgi:hypothetical protein
VQEEFGRSLRVAHLFEVFDGFIEPAAVEFGISRGNAGDHLRLAGWIFGAGPHDEFAQPANAFKIQCEGAEPGLPKIEKPGIASVLFGHLFSRAHNLQYSPNRPKRNRAAVLRPSATR